MFGFAAAPEIATAVPRRDAIVVLVAVLPRSPISVLPQRGGRLRRLLLHVFKSREYRREHEGFRPPLLRRQFFSAR